MNPTLKPNSNIAAGFLAALMALTFTACANVTDIADETCTESQSFFIQDTPVASTDDHGNPPDIRLTVFTIDPSTDCLERVIEGNCLNGDCDFDLDLTLARQELFIRVVATDPTGVQNIDIGLDGGVFEEADFESDSPWVTTDYSLNESVVSLYADTPLESVLFQDVFNMHTNRETMRIICTAKDFGDSGADPTSTSSTVAVTISHSDALPTSVL